MVVTSVWSIIVLEKTESLPSLSMNPDSSFTVVTIASTLVVVAMEFFQVPVDVCVDQVKLLLSSNSSVLPGLNMGVVVMTPDSLECLFDVLDTCWRITLVFSSLGMV